MSSLEDRIQSVEDDVEALVPESQQARLKVFLDQFMPVALIMLGSLVTFNFFVTPGEQVSSFVNVLYVSLVLFFVARFMLAFSLAESHTEFLRNHWFDALLVLPAFSLLKDIRILYILESEAEERAVLGFFFGRATMVSSQIARIYSRVRRTLRL